MVSVEKMYVDIRVRMAKIMESMIRMSILLVLVREVSPFGQALREYCHQETFEAECPPGSVILVEEAIYGRMALGGCITLDYGQLGCSRDVVGQLDAWCSGRLECSFLVSTLHDIGACHKDLVSYLKASWSCLPVLTAESDPCSPSSPLVVTQQQGFLASAVAESSQRGSEGCPWLLRALPGQSINITIWNFARARADLGADTTGMHARICYRFAVLHDEGIEHQLTECEGGPRLVSARLSSSHEVLVSFLFRDSATDYYFLLEFHVVGCPTPKPPPGARVRRVGDRADITCNFTTESWTVTCDGTRWHGTIGNCSRVVSPNDGGFFSTNGGFPYGILIVVSIGVALGVFFGGILLTLASIYMKRRRQRQQPCSQPPAQGRIYDFADTDKGFQTLPAQAYQPYGPRRSVPSSGTVHDPRLKEGVLPEATYQQYAPQSTECTHYSGRSTPGSSHIYESPKFQRKFNV